MRDLEFLPAWYPKLRERKRMVRLQAYMTLLLAVGLSGWIYLIHRNIRTDATSLAAIDRELSQSHREMSQLQTQRDEENQLLLQRRIVDRLGLQVDLSRLLTTLDQKMPRGISLTDCAFDTQEQTKVVNTLAVARTIGRGDGIDRRLLVHLQGVAPTDDDVANFLAGLTNVPFFDQVAMSYSKDRTQDGRLMREFEITFSLDLNQQAGE